MLLITTALHPRPHPATAFPLGNHAESPPNLPPEFPSIPGPVSHPQTTPTAPQPTLAPLPLCQGVLSRAVPSPCSQSRAGYSPKASPKNQSRLQLDRLCRGADRVTIKHPGGKKLIFLPRKDLRLLRKLQTKAEVPPPLRRTGSGWGGSVGGDGDFTALRGRLMKSCCCSPLGAQLGEAACPYPPSPSRPPSAEAGG